MKWYLKVVRDNYANFNGRARRQEYWMFVLFNAIFIIAIATISGGIASATDTPALFGLYAIYTLGVFIPSLAVGVRRLHDVGKSGWFYLIGLIPFIGGIWLFVLFVTEGDKGPNQYGPDPKIENSLEIDEIGKPQVEA
ncbi:DUF805 domain-containing protein [Thalassobellus suaedae]|uniref:DUF805 domain-containing protein n=1 Tax=Thalassobellus suaedae TaxID=3074124 RepID=A0ABY9XPK1_9FLAO|nr:DUF805 domain-containing protein [Flavobacteriaceae bacterium HL-DH14]WNH13136.1 DUF805 domain-containing protein [Flavobacteriaceae bacterium HL-DH10]